jgi:hypothetical protein
LLPTGAGLAGTAGYCRRGMAITRRVSVRGMKNETGEPRESVASGFVY